MLEFNSFIRTPFQIQAILITEENIEEVAKLIDSTVVDDEATGKHILVNRKVVPSIGRAYIGWYFTTMGDAFRCYAPKVFEKQFVTMPKDGIATFAFDPSGPYAKLVTLVVPPLPPPPVAPEGWPSE